MNSERFLALGVGFSNRNGRESVGDFQRSSSCHLPPDMILECSWLSQNENP